MKFSFGLFIMFFSVTYTCFASKNVETIGDMDLDEMLSNDQLEKIYSDIPTEFSHQKINPMALKESIEITSSNSDNIREFSIPITFGESIENYSNELNIEVNNPSSSFEFTHEKINPTL